MHTQILLYFRQRHDVDFSMARSLTLSTRPHLCGVIMQSDPRVAQFATRTMRIFRSSPDWTDRRVLCLASLIFNPALLSEPPQVYIFQAYTPFKSIDIAIVIMSLFKIPNC